MPVLSSFDYAVVRVVPRVEREEFMNAGVIVFCRTQRFLEARIALNHARLRAFAPWLDLDETARYLEAIPLICRGGRAAGPIGAATISERFHWLVAPRSTVIQMSPVHVGLCADPAIALAHLMAAMVVSPV